MRLNIRSWNYFRHPVHRDFGRMLLAYWRDGGEMRTVFLWRSITVVGSIGVFSEPDSIRRVRERECLADASSVQFTRNPAGLPGALQKSAVYSFSYGCSR